jgi:hypothetical protein
MPQGLPSLELAPCKFQKETPSLLLCSTPDGQGIFEKEISACKGCVVFTADEVDRINKRLIELERHYEANSK